MWCNVAGPFAERVLNVVIHEPYVRQPGVSALRDLRPNEIAA